MRYRGKIWVRVGPRKAVANESDERVLRERQKSYDLTFDATPRFDAKQEDLRIDLFKSHYLPRAVDAKILEEDARSLLQKMAALRFYDIANGCPTNAGLLLFGKNPEYFFFGGYLQYVKFGGTGNSAPVLSEFKFSGNLVEMLVKLDSFIETGIAKRRPVPASALREESVIAYPHWAMRELVLNAVMHRDYQANAPIKFYEYSDRVEITNPGGLYGLARPENFPDVNDYRNPIIAEALKVLGYVNRFNRGIALAQKEFFENGNGKILFDVKKQTVFCCSVSKSYSFTHEEETACEVLAETDSGNIRKSASLLSAINSNGTINSNIEPSGTINGTINSDIEPSGTINNEIKIKNLIGAHPGIKRAGLSVKTGISVRTIARILKSLKESGAVEYRGSKKSGGWYPKT